MNKLFGLNFYNKEIEDLIIDLENDIKCKNKVTVFTPNVDHIINNKSNMKVEKLYEKSDYIISDGWPLVVTGRLKKKKIKRITGVDLMDQLLILANKNKYNLFFLGATDETLMLLKKNIESKYPNLGSVSYHHGFFSNDDEVISKINSTENNILFVGMGNPKQEIWIRENYERLNSNIILGVGGALKIFSEEVERAPKLIQCIGMEWFYRFTKEPKRLFSRYFIKYPSFIGILIKELVN